MSTLIVEVCNILDVRPHPDPETIALEIAIVKGWECVVKKGSFQVGDKCVFVPVDAVVPSTLSDALGVTNYLAKLPEGQEGGRVRAARLRGAKSFGLLFALDPAWGCSPDWEIGTDVAESLGITKWVPPLRCVDGDAMHPNPRFHVYTDIENIRNFPNAIKEGEEVALTEKIHGSNGRWGYILDMGENGEATWTLMAGSHAIRRKEYDMHGKLSKFWEVFSENAVSLLKYLVSSAMPDRNRDRDWPVPKNGIILFGEVYGNQDMKYGLVNGKQAVRYFDIAINGQYLDDDAKEELFTKFGLQRVPVLYRGPFSWAVVDEYTDGRTTICDPAQAGKFKGREGAVITPIKERFSGELGGRCIAKSVSVDYLSRKNDTDILE